MCGQCSSTARASRIGLRIRCKPATAPARSVSPFITIASHSTRPSRLRCDPYPASKTGSSSSTTIAASTACSAEPPCERIGQPASRARRQPELQASTASSGISQAPPCTISEGFIATRMAKRAQFVHKGDVRPYSSLNEEIEKHENRTQKKQEESRIYLPARESAK